MKKFFTLMFVAGAMSIVACGPSEEEKAKLEAETKAKMDSIFNAASQSATTPADTTTAAPADSTTAPAATTEHHESKIAITKKPRLSTGLFCFRLFLLLKYFDGFPKHII
jgi:hypothetical protein